MQNIESQLPKWRTVEEAENVETVSFANFTLSSFFLKKPKDSDFDITSFISENISGLGNAHQQTQSDSAGLKLKNNYFQVKSMRLVTVQSNTKKKSDQGFEIYKCSVSNDTVEIACNELSNSISVSVAKMDNDTKVAHVGVFQVNLHDKLIESLKPVLENLDSFGQILFNGKFLKEEETPVSLGMKDSSQLLVLQCGSVGRVEPVMWFRTKKEKIEWGDYTNVSTEYYDALKFKAKRDVLFCGVGMIKEYDSQPFVLEMKYRITGENDDDDAEATVIEVDNETSPVNEEKMHWFDI